MGTEASELEGAILLACNLVAKVATLGCEVRVLAQALDPAKQELQLPVRSSGCVLGNLSGKVSNSVTYVSSF